MSLKPLLISPLNGDTLRTSVSLRLKSTDDTGALSHYTLSLGGIPLSEPTLSGGMYRLLLDTQRYSNGTALLSATATHSVDGAVTDEISVTLDNSLQTNIEYHLVKATNQRTGEEITSVDVGLKTFALPAVNRLRYWTQARIFTDGTEGVPDMNAIEPQDMDAMASLWELGQPVSLVTGKITAASGTREECQLRYASGELLLNPGQTAWLMLRLVPLEALEWWPTHFEQVVVAKRSESSSAGTETWHVLARNLDNSGAALFEFKVTGDDAAPAASFVQKVDLTDQAPDALDFAVVGSKLYIVRDDNKAVRVFDLDSGRAILDQSIVGENRLPRFINNCGGKPVLILVAADESPPTSCYDMSFEDPQSVWTLNEVVTSARWAFNLVGVLGITAGPKLYTSASGTDGPVLAHTFGRGITALGSSAPNGIGLNTYVGLDEGSVYLSDMTGWKLAATLPSSVDSVTAWKSDGEVLGGVAGRDDGTLTEQQLDGSWGSGVTLEPPEGIDPIAGVFVLEEMERFVTPASGTEGQPNFAPAVTDIRLLIGTGAKGMFGNLQRSSLNPAAGAFLSYGHDESYLVPLTTPIQTEEPA